ncbi:hypothetical protein QE152_g26497 [Popillia japonica]|uniref:Uncharacterized protein n=1 Tax=Popillia japonica TaxID=7064 RepID=A0AAW1JYJ7_POPJA
MITIHVSYSGKKPQRVQTRLFNNDTLQSIKAELSQVQWYEVTKLKDINVSYYKFVQILASLIDKHAKMRVITERNGRRNWLTPELKMQFQIKRQLYEGVISGRINKGLYNTFCANLKQKIDEKKKRCLLQLYRKFNE